MIITKDNFLFDPHKERSLALSAKYSTAETMSGNYNGIAESHSEEQNELFRATISKKDGTINSYYRRYKNEDGVKDFIHNDSGVGQIVGILFLTEAEKCSGGLAFWRHKLYGWQFYPTSKDAELFGLEINDELNTRLKIDGEHENKWEMIDYVPMYFNRIVIFPGAIFHSRYPQIASEERLIKAFSYTP